MIKIHSRDNVSVALQDFSRGKIFNGVTAREDIPRGHKLALVDIKKGEQIIKYGFPIGIASADIAAGTRIHSHNLSTGLSGVSEYHYDPDFAPVSPAPPATFSGFLRKDGRAGIRNDIWVIPTVGCVNGVAQKIANLANSRVHGNVGRVTAFTHPYGCSQTGDDMYCTSKLLADLARHPNAGGVLLLGLGCENNTKEIMLGKLGDYDTERIRFLVSQEHDDEIADSLAIIDELIGIASKDIRTELPLSMLTVGMKCGGSDGLSGITANPIVGKVSDMIVAHNGISILTETPEMFGAEQLLMSRCINRDIFDKAVNMINGFKNYYIAHQQPVYENPSPGNKAGGITTLEEKSLGCVQKGGIAPVCDVLEYGDRVSTHGLNLLSGPGNDLVSSTALAAAGAQVVIFTTGRGTPFGAPVPTIKVATNSNLYERKTSWLDFNAGVVAEGADMNETADRLFRLMLDVASGKAETKSESDGYREIAIFKNGVTL